MFKIPDLSLLSNSWLGLLFLFALFLIFTSAILGWGYRILGRKELDLSARAAASFLGASLFTWAVPMLLGSLQLLQLPVVIWILLLTPGLYWVLPLLKESWQKCRENSLWFFLFAFLFLVRAFAAALPQAHGDPLLYHLLGPRLWVQHGGFYVSPDLPNAILASSWEYLYIWPQRFFSYWNNASALANAQIFSQWSHLVLGWIGLAILLPLLFREERLEKKWNFLLALSALFISGLQWTAGLAKNDAGIALWCLGAVWFFHKATEEKKRTDYLMLAGIFSGLAISGKVTASLNIFFLILAIAMFVIISEGKKGFQFLPRALIFISIGFLASAIPLYARNYFLTSNPFYPMFNAIFPSPWVSLTWERHFAQVHPSFAGSFLHKILFRIPELFRESPWILLAPFALIWDLFTHKKIPWFLNFFAHAALLIFIITQASEIELRYMGAVMLVLAGTGIVFFARLDKKMPINLRPYFFIILLMASLAASKLPIHILRKQWSSHLGEQYVLTHTAGESKGWLRQNMKPGEKAIVAGDNEAYYLSTVDVTVLTENPELDRATFYEKNLRNFLKSICSITHARYLLDARPGIGFAGRFGNAAGAESKVFESQGSPIYDLYLLGKSQKIDMQSCN